MNGKEKNIVDVSSFFLFEAIGDSECSNISDPGSDDSIAMDEDDAESCCWDSSDHNRPILDDQDYLLRDDNDDEEEEEQEQEQEQEERKNEIYENWDSGHFGKPIGHQKSSVSEDSTEEKFELLDETEKSKLFWETCLAS
ncbi:hypothetical protein UlMin_031331 [Ulmus minor]